MSSPIRAIALIGAGGLGRETAELVRAINAVQPTWDLLGFYDDDPSLQGTRVGGLRVLGTVADAAETDAVALAICTARPGIGCSRARIAARLDLPDARLPALVHPTASLGSSTVVGTGSILLAGVVATADVEVGSHVVVMPQTVLTHDDRIGDFVTIASGVRLGGGVRIGDEAYIGAAASVREGVEIGASALVGMGSVVLNDVPGGETWVGAPAHLLERPRLAAAHPPARGDAGPERVIA